MEGQLAQFNSMSFQKKVVLLALLGATVAGIVYLISWAKTPEYGVLFSNLEQEDVQLVITKLKEKKEDFKVVGSAVMVPENRMYELRMEMAGEGVPRGGGVGFEIFDKNSIGMTDFLQKMNYKRALQGELSRTIRQLSEVEDCRVHLVIPEHTVFLNSQEHSRASVVLKLKGGRSLSQEQSMAIVHLVSSSVEDLAANDVTLIDTKGRMLSRPREDDSLAMLSSTQLEYRKAVEKDLESRVQSMLETVLGRGKAVVRVSADMDFTQQEQSEERYDPASVIRSQQKSSEKETNGRTVAAGIPGAVSNLPGKDAAQNSVSKQPSSLSERQSETSNYEISMSKSHTIKPTGTVKGISAAVLIDGTYETKDNKKVYTARQADEMAKLEGIVKGALGFSVTRGDKVEIVNVPFESSAVEAEMQGEGKAEDEAWYKVYIIPYIKYMVAGIAVLLLFFFVVRPLVKSLGTSLEAPPNWEGQPVRVGELEAGMPKQPYEPKAITQVNVREIVQQNPAKAASVVKVWLKEK